MRTRTRTRTTKGRGKENGTTRGKRRGKRGIGTLCREGFGSAGLGGSLDTWVGVVCPACLGVLGGDWGRVEVGVGVGVGVGVEIEVEVGSDTRGGRMYTLKEGALEQEGSRERCSSTEEMDGSYDSVDFAPDQACEVFYD